MKFHWKWQRTLKVSIYLGLLKLSFMTSIDSAAYYIPEQSARSIGFAGAMTSVVDDVSSIFFNPANTAFLKEGNYFKASGLLVDLSAEYTRAPDSLSPGGYGKKTNNDPLSAIPFIGLGKKNRETADFYGIALYSPFGLSSQWDSDGPQRYNVTESGLTPIFITPTYAKRLTDDLSVGLGLNFVISEVTLKRKAALGNLLFAQTNDPSFLENQQYDSEIDILMKDPLSLSANLGMSYTLTENSRVGWVYRSQTSLSLEGDYEVPAIHNSFSTLGSSFKSDVSGDLKLPQFFGLGYTYQSTHEKIFTVDLQWMDWSVVDHIFLDLKKDNHPVFKDLNIQRKWNDSYALRTGYEFPAGWQNFKGRVGMFFESSPISNEYLDSTVLSNQNFGISLGLGYKDTDSQWDFGYMHVFSPPRDSNSSANSPASNGHYNYSIDLLGVSYLRTF